MEDGSQVPLPLPRQIPTAVSNVRELLEIGEVVANLLALTLPLWLSQLVASFSMVLPEIACDSSAPFFGSMGAASAIALGCTLPYTKPVVARREKESECVVRGEGVV